MKKDDMAAMQGVQQIESQNQDDQSQGAPKAVIELTVAQDGSITVELETGSQEAGESGTEGSDESGGSEPVSVKDIGEALQVIEKMYTSVTQDAVAAKADQVSGYSGQ